MSECAPCPFRELPRPLVPVGTGADDELNRTITLELLALFHDAIHRYAMRLLALKVSPLANPLRGQGQVLAVLKQSDGLTTRELARLLDIRTASLNELLVKLEAKGLIERSRSDADGRVMIVSLTDAGRAVEQAPFVAEMQTFLGEMGDFYEPLTLEEKKALADMLRRIDDAMRRSVSAEARDGNADVEVASADAAAIESSEIAEEDLEGRIVRDLEMWGTLSKLARALDLDPRRDSRE